VAATSAGGVPGVEQDIELIDPPVHGDVGEDGHADNGPNPTFHGHAATVQGGNALFAEGGNDEIGGNEVRE